MARAEQIALATIGGSAVFSPDEKHRYVLRRAGLGGRGALAVIGVNPSTATATTNDPTVRRCIGFAQALGFDELCMLNLFGWRDVDVTTLLRADDPVGPLNNAHIAAVTASARQVVCAWGAKSGRLGQLVRERARFVARLIDKPLHAFRVTRGGHPEHPLYLPSDLQPVSFEVPRG